MSSLRGAPGSVVVVGIGILASLRLNLAWWAAIALVVVAAGTGEAVLRVVNTRLPAEGSPLTRGQIWVLLTAASVLEIAIALGVLWMVIRVDALRG